MRSSLFPSRLLLPLFLLLPILASNAGGEESPEQELLFTRAQAAVRDYECREAEAIYRRILESDSGSAGAHYGLGRALSGCGDHRGARRHYLEALRLEPDRAAPHAGLGGLAIYLDRRVEARSSYRAALELEPEHPPSLAGLARVAIEEGSFEEADRLLLRAEASQPELDSVLSARSEWHYRQGNMPEAVRLLRRVVEVEERNISAHHRLACGFVEPEREIYRTPPALPAFERSFALALSLYRDRRFAPASRAFVALDDEQAPDGRPAFFLGLVALREGRPREAIEHLWRAVEREPDAHLYRNALVNAYRLKVHEQRAEYGGSDGVDRLRPFVAHLPAPEVPLIGRVVRGYDRLLPAEQAVVRRAAAPLARFLPILVTEGVTHDILGFEEGMCDAEERAWLLSQRTHDGRWYGGLRGVGGADAATGIESLLFAADLTYDTFAHELMHQVHVYALSTKQQAEVSRLYAAAKKQDRCLDYYAASNDREYLAQGYEAFVSLVKSPFTHHMRRHTRAELADRDPALYAFLLGLTGTPDPDPLLAVLAPELLAFYEWAGDEESLRQIRSLLP